MQAKSKHSVGNRRFNGVSSLDEFDRSVGNGLFKDEKAFSVKSLLGTCCHRFLPA